MRKILTLMVVTSLLASPALAMAGPNGPDNPEKPAKIDLMAAAKAAGKEVAAEGTTPLSTPAPQNGVAKGKLWVGVAMIALGAGVVWKGADLYDNEPDPFGRKKNADAYLAMGVGSVITLFGVLAVRGGLAGRGFND
ncbi:MAG: hypothetical protein PVJ49_05445 [Acidobacteriota bacterium]|jgi:hypothetical protein